MCVETLLLGCLPGLLFVFQVFIFVSILVLGPRLT